MGKVRRLKHICDNGIKKKKTFESQASEKGILDGQLYLELEKSRKIFMNEK
jgi:hypothetical protein